MFAKEYDFIRYLRMSNRSEFLRSLYSKVIQNIACDELIYVPMIDGISLTADQIKKYENPNYILPTRDRITPIIAKAERIQNLEFFRDARSFNDKNAIQVRVLYS